MLCVYEFLKSSEVGLAPHTVLPSCDYMSSNCQWQCDSGKPRMRIRAASLQAGV